MFFNLGRREDVYVQQLSLHCVRLLFEESSQALVGVLIKKEVTFTVLQFEHVFLKYHAFLEKCTQASGRTPFHIR